MGQKRTCNREKRACERCVEGVPGINRFPGCMFFGVFFIHQQRPVYVFWGVFHTPLVRRWSPHAPSKTAKSNVRLGPVPAPGSQGSFPLQTGPNGRGCRVGKQSAEWSRNGRGKAARGDGEKAKWVQGGWAAKGRRAVRGQGKRRWKVGVSGRWEEREVEGGS